MLTNYITLPPQNTRTHYNQLPIPKSNTPKFVRDYSHWPHHPAVQRRISACRISGLQPSAFVTFDFPHPFCPPISSSENKDKDKT